MTISDNVAPSESPTAPAPEPVKDLVEIVDEVAVIAEPTPSGSPVGSSVLFNARALLVSPELLADIKRDVGEALLGGDQPQLPTPIVLGVRVRTTDGDSEPISDTFDDFIGVALSNPVLPGGFVVTLFHGTTDPGMKYSVNTLNPDGVALWALGFNQDSHTFGLHRGKYEALVQHNPARFMRDGDLNDRHALGGDIQEGYIGLNVHAAANDPYNEYTWRSAGSVAGSVGGWSAGCWVIANSPDFVKFMSILTATGSTVFSTLLLETASND